LLAARTGEKNNVVFEVNGHVDGWRDTGKQRVGSFSLRIPQSLPRIYLT
jgi:hypothetical protein